ncbi:3'-5' exonuclease [Undibacterium parvum]|uniref:DNA 3'-5' helicase n=1 Tax=Undibacterium parvum TaxID=401471 RepID=A0A3Q9BRF8_9BURK|nr:3'-5' exonuclease [Undibacterium parvum]AZP12763.1 ATP-dependent helicase [Undibacterium parvum]
MIKTDAPRFVPKGLIPTTEQVAIQLAKNKTVIIKANAGAAKTTTLALRIGEAIARKLEPENILALVFTPEAKEVLKKRLLEIGIPATTAARLHVASFNDFASEVLEKIELRKVPYLPHSKDLKDYVIAAMENLSDKCSEQRSDQYGDQVEFLEISTHSLAISQFINAQLAMKAKMSLLGDFESMELEEVSTLLGVQLAEYLTAIEYELIRLGNDDRVLFRGPFDASYDLARILDAEPYTKNLLPRYRLILCDELHDLNEASFRILLHLIDPSYTYFVGAGDKDQVIHSKLGASDEYINSRFKMSFPAMVSYPLTNCYRHGPHLAYAMEAFKNKPIESPLALRTEISQLTYDMQENGDNSACAAQVISAIQRWHKAKHAISACAILVRERHQSIAIENALMQADIAYHTLEMKSYLQREEILFLRGVIAIALKNFGSVKSKKIRGEIFDALLIFAEISLAPGENIEDFRASAIDTEHTPEALSWFFAGRLSQDGSKELRQRLHTLLEQLQASAKTQSAELVLGELNSALAGLLDYVRAAVVHGLESQVFGEVEDRLQEITAYLQRSILASEAALLLRELRNSLLSLQNSLDRSVEQGVKNRMVAVVAYVASLDADTPADAVLREICRLIDIQALAKRLYVHAYDAMVVSKSVQGFIAAAAQTKMNLRDFSVWIGAADEFISARKTKQSVLLECAANAKGKEFDHVILPYLEKSEFPFAGQTSTEEENLFYVAATRAKLCLTLISPKEEAQRSPYIARMKISGSKARADAAVDKNGEQLSGPNNNTRIEFKANGDDWALAKSLGANWDFARKVFYLKEDQDPMPFVKWLRSLDRF